MSEKPTRAWAAWRHLFGLGLLLGALAGAGIDVGDRIEKGHVEAKDFCMGAGAFGAAFAAVNVTVLALVVVWSDGPYSLVIHNLGGWAKTMLPIRVASTMSLLTVLASIVGLLLLDLNILWLNALTLGITGFFLAWTLMGTLIVINNLFAHGEARFEILYEDTLGVEQEGTHGVEQEGTHGVEQEGTHGDA
jgi:hypothetical protein